MLTQPKFAHEVRDEQTERNARVGLPATQDLPQHWDFGQLQIRTARLSNLQLQHCAITCVSLEMVGCCRQLDVRR